MHFELTPDQLALQDGVRNFCAGRFDIDSVRALADVGVDRTSWTELADMGVFALRLAEDEGGVGLGWADAVLVFEQLGRALVPGPLVWTHLAAGSVPGAAEGRTVVGGIDRHDPSRLIECFDALDQLLIVDDDGVWVTATDDLVMDDALLALDPLTPVRRLAGDLPQGDRLLDAADGAQFVLRGAALVAAQLLGASEASRELAVTYAMERVQFDKPIGAFQAVKHLLADMFTRTEVARGAVYAAGVTLDDPLVGSVERAVAAAKLTAGEAAIGNGKTCVQVHGGMGYTWEVDAHLLFKRAYALDPLFGARDDWADRMADLLEAATL